jgi:hypothetical protein
VTIKENLLELLRQLEEFLPGESLDRPLGVLGFGRDLCVYVRRVQKQMKRSALVGGGQNSTISMFDI